MRNIQRTKIIFCFILCFALLLSCGKNNDDRKELSLDVFLDDLSRQSSPEEVKRLLTERELKLIKAEHMGHIKIDYYSGGNFFNHDIHNLSAQYFKEKLYFIQYQLLSFDSELNELFSDFIRIFTADYGEPEFSNDEQTEWKFEQETDREVTLHISLSPQTQKVILIYIKYRDYVSIE